MVDQYEEEVDLIEREYRNKFKHVYHYASVEDGDGEHPYVSYSGGVTFELPDELMLPMPKPKEDEKWSESPNYKLREHVRKWAKENDIYSVNDIEVNGNEVRIDVYDDGNMDPDSYRDFLSGTMTDLDEKYDELLASLYQLFVSLGYAQENKVAWLNNNWDEHPHQFTHFKWEGDEPAIMVSISEPIELPTPPESSAGYQHEYGYWQDQFKQTVMKEINAWADKVLEADKQQPSLFPDFMTHNRAFAHDMKIVPHIEITPKNSWQKAQPGQPLYMRMSLSFAPFENDADVEEGIKFITFLDKHYQQFESMILSIYSKWVGNWGKAQPATPPHLDLTGMSTDQQIAALNQQTTQQSS